jgi:hypothetical protein
MELKEEKILQEDRRKLREHAIFNEIGRLKKHKSSLERKLRKRTFLFFFMVFFLLGCMYLMVPHKTMNKSIAQNGNARLSEPIQYEALTTVDTLIIDTISINYRIQLGAFSQRVPTFESRLDSFEIKWINEKGLIKYYLGNFKSYEYTKNLLNIISKNGFPDVFIYQVKEEKKIIQKEHSQIK